MRDYLFWIVSGYLSGSVMYAYWISRIFGKKDIILLSKDHNPGVANTFMIAGIPLGILALVCELLKGALPVFAAARCLDTARPAFAAVLCAPVIGHAFPLPFPKEIRGGKAIAVSFGCLIGLFPEWRPLGYLVLFYLFFSLILKVSPHLYRSIVTFFCFALMVWLNVRAVPVRIGCTVIAAVTTFKHWIQHADEPLKLSFGLHTGK